MIIEDFPKIKLHFLLFCLFVVLSVQLSAQVVNIEKKRGGDTIGWQGDVLLSLDLTSNTTKIFQFKNDIQLQYNQIRSTLLIFNNISYVNAADQNFINSGFQHLRYNYRFKPRFLQLEGFTQYQYNLVNKVQSRFLAGGGPRFSFIDSARSQLILGPLFMYENEKLTTENLHSEKLRMSAYISFNYQLNKLLNFSHTTYYQPDLANFSDYRIASESNLKIKISDKLSIKLIYILNFDSDPPLSVPSLVYSFSNGLNYSFWSTWTLNEFNNQNLKLNGWCPHQHYTNVISDIFVNCSMENDQPIFFYTASINKFQLNNFHLAKTDIFYQIYWQRNSLISQDFYLLSIFETDEL